jgi:predicted Zn-dependent peptidase
VSGVDRARIEAAVSEIILAIGEDPARPGLAKTPARVADAYAEFFSGLSEDPLEHLLDSVPIGEDSDGVPQTSDVVLLRGIDFRSVCEHHLLPFVGVVHIAYLPSDRIVGLGKLPAVVDTTLANGLRVLAARKPGIPMVQARLRFDVASGRSFGDGVLEDIVASTVLAGTPSHSQIEIADEMQRVGGDIGAMVDADNLFISATCLADELGRYLRLLGDIVANADYPEDEIALAKAQTEQGIAIMHSQPAARAQYALAERVFPGHVYGRPMPTPDLVAPISRAAARKYHRAVARPAGALLTLVGDLPPAKMVAAADKALGDWTGSRRIAKTPPPAPLAAGPMRIVHQPGAVQTNIRLGGIGVGRAHPDFPALTLALTILGGGFTSRLNHNLREDKGFTYGAFAGVAHNVAVSAITVGADVQTSVTAPALVETLYELGRMATAPVTVEELEDAKRYLAGNLAMATETQAGLASYVTSLAIAGLDVSYLRELPVRAAKLTVDDIAAATAKYVAPSLLAPVLVGDADVIRDAVGRIGEIEVVG